MKKSRSTQRLASLAVGSMAMGTALLPSAKAQGTVVINQNETVNWGGSVNGLAGNGNGAANGSTVTGSFTFNPYTALRVSGTGAPNSGSTYDFVGDTVSVTAGGINSSYNDLQVLVFNNGFDASGSQHPADFIAFSWNSGGDWLDMDYPVSVAPDSSINSFQSMLDLGLTGSLPYAGDAIFGVYDASGMNGAVGNLSSFDPVATPEPSTIAMGTLGAAGLLALRRMRGIKKNEPALNR